MADTQNFYPILTSTRSLWSDVEVLLSVMVKTSRCSTKLLLMNILHNFDNIFKFQANFRIFTKFWDFKQISEYQSNFRI